MIFHISSCVDRLMGEKVAKFSPWGIVRKNEFTIGRQNISYELAGISVIDYLDLYKKSPATPNQESYKLDHIALRNLVRRNLITVSMILSVISIPKTGRSL